MGEAYLHDNKRPAKRTGQLRLLCLRNIEGVVFMTSAGGNLRLVASGGIIEEIQNNATGDGDAQPCKCANLETQWPHEDFDQTG